METWDAITSRRNVREFEDRPIPEADLERILEAARRAPSASNRQLWDFVVVTDREQLQELSGVWQGGGHIARSAAAVAIVVPDESEQRMRELHAVDLGQASLQMMVAAADLGIGSGHSSVGDQDLARRVLGLPDDRIVGIIIDFGYPADRPLRPIRNPLRRPFDEVVHQGRW
jgi:nitroreductase